MRIMMKVLQIGSSIMALHSVLVGILTHSGSMMPRRRKERLLLLRVMAVTNVIHRIHVRMCGNAHELVFKACISCGYHSLRRAEHRQAAAVWLHAVHGRERLCITVKRESFLLLILFVMRGSCTREVLTAALRASRGCQRARNTRASRFVKNSRSIAELCQCQSSLSINKVVALNHFSRYLRSAT